MAFGKNPANITNVGSFRQMGHTWNQSKTKRTTQSSGGMVPPWVNEYKPPTTGLDLIRVIAGDYTVQEADRNGNVTDIEHLPFYPFVEHFDARSKKRCTCSAGPLANIKGKRDACHGCDFYWAGIRTNEAGKREKGFMGKRDMVAFTIVHLHDYHKAPQRDDKGLAKLNPNTGEPFYSWTRCSKDINRRGKCAHCDEGMDAKYGHRMHWAMGNDHYNTLLNKDEEIGQSCSACGGVETIGSQAWVCPNPDCGEAIIEDSTALSAKEVAAIVGRPVTCASCKQTNYATEILECAKCPTPKRATLFDVDLKLSRIEAPDGTNRTTLNISSFSEPRPLPPELAELGKPERLDKIYAPTSLEVQAMLFQVNAGMRQPVTAASAARPYGSK